MDVSALIPAADPIPVHYGWFWFLLILTFTLHLMIMNAMLGTGIIALFSHLTNKNNDRFPTKTISRKLPFLIAFTVNSGVAPLLFLQVLYGQFIYTSFILMAVFMLFIVVFLMAAYYGAYIYDFKYDTLSIRTRNILIGMIVVLFLIIGFMFSNTMTLMLNPNSWIRYFSNASGTLLNLKDPTLAPRYLHVVFAAIANGGLFLALLHEKQAVKGDKIARNKQQMAMKWFSFALMFNLVVGVWFLLSLPKEIFSLFMGKHIYATLLLVSGIISALLALHLSLKNNIRACTAVTVLTLVDMVLIRDLVRHLVVKPYFQIKDLTVIPQYTPMIFFFAVMLFSAVAIFYMIRQAITAGKEA